MSTWGMSLPEAAQAGDYDAVSELLDSGADVDEGSPGTDSTAIGLASLNGDVDLVELLLQYGANADYANNHGVRPIHVACEKGHTQIVSMLIDAGVDVNATWMAAQTPLHIATKAKPLCRELVDLLLASGADVRAAEEDGTTPLHYAVIVGCPELVKLYLERGADSHAVAGPMKRTPLCLAVCCIDEADPRREIVGLLLKAGADPKRTTIIPDPPMCAAGSNERYDLMEMMLQAWGGVDDPVLNGSSLLHWASEHTTAPCIQMLLRNGGHPNVTSPPLSRTALHFAACNYRDDDALVGMLLDAGAEVDATDDLGWTPLHAAVHSSNPRVVETLLTRGADVNAKVHVTPDPIDGVVVPPFDAAPLDVAINIELAFARGLATEEMADEPSARRRVMHLLVEHGGIPVDIHMAELAIGHGEPEVIDALMPLWVDLTQPRDDGSSLLNWAAGGANVYLVKRLLEQGADPSQHSGPQGTTPLHEAVRSGSPEICAELIAAGSAIDAKSGDNWTPLHFAVMGDDVAVARLLLTAKADPNSVGNLHRHFDRQDKLLTSKCSPLDLLIQMHLAFVRERVAQGGPADAEERLRWMRKRVSEGDKDSPNRAELAEILTSAGATVNDWAAAVRAFVSGDAKLAQALLPLWKNPNKPLPDGDYILHHTAAVGDAELVRRLLKMGADPVRATGPGADPVTPLDIARQNGHAEVLQLLLAASRGLALPEVGGDAAPPAAPPPPSAPTRTTEPTTAERITHTPPPTSARRSRLPDASSPDTEQASRRMDDRQNSPLPWRMYVLVGGLILATALGAMGVSKLSQRQVTVAGARAFNPLGEWNGTVDGHPASFRVTKQKNYAFRGQIQITDLSFAVLVEGFLTPGTDNISLKEVLVTGAKRGQNWSLGRNVGYLSADGTRMGGKRFSPIGQSSWSLRKKR